MAPDDRMSSRTAALRSCFKNVTSAGRARLRGGDKIVGNGFEQLQAGPERGELQGWGESKPEGTREYMRIASRRATQLWQAQQFVKQLLSGSYSPTNSDPGIENSYLTFSD
ncbi:MAG: hypothetical protein ACFCVA_03490 [Gammaproteobacteria bacterium]